MQAYLALGGTVDGLVDDAGLDWRTDLRARFMLDNLLDALAPTNFPLTNPQVLKETIDRGGANLVTGGAPVRARRQPRPAAGDGRHQPASRSAATSRSARARSSLRTEVFELIQYRPDDGGGLRDAAARSCRRRSTSSTSSISRRDAAWSSTWSARATRCSASRGATPTPSTATSTSTPTRRRSLEARDAAAEIAKQRRGQRDGGLLGRDHHGRACSAIWPTKAGSARSRA